MKRTRISKRAPKNKAKRPRPVAKESEEIIQAIRRGNIDALVVERGDGNQVLTLQNSEHPYRVLVENISDGAATLDAAGTVLYANSRFLEILKINDLNFVGTSLQSHLTHGDQRTVQDLIEKGLYSSIQGEITLVAPNERARLVRLALHPIPSGDDKSICAVATEITELVEANEALRANEESLRLLSARLLKLQDEERRRIARDLHDITGQKLAVQTMTLSQVLKGDSSLDPKSRQMLAECVNLNKQVGEEIRTLSYLLHPPLLDELGLASAVKWYAEGFEHKTGIRLEVNMSSELQRFPPDVEVALFRVIQESLTNVHRYSGSPNGFVRITATPDEIEVQIGDVGSGMNHEKLERLKGRGAPLGVGIQGMRERMRQLGGRLEIFSEAHKGTRVTATIPLSSLQPAVPSISSNGVNSPRTNGQTDATSVHPTSQKTILIVDDHEMLRRGIRTMLQQEKDWEVVGEATDGHDAIQQAKSLSPDLVILDVNLPGLNGLAAIRQILFNRPQTKILVFTVHDSDQTEREVHAAGAHGYVSKGKGGEDLLRVMRDLLGDKTASAGSNP